jgi:hypothetical protein
MRFPPAIKPEPQPGPDDDPLDRIITALENIESFLGHLTVHPTDFEYLNTHLPPILASRREISQQIDKLFDEPYHYTRHHLKTLHQENETLFTYLEGAVGATEKMNETEFKKFLKTIGEQTSKFDNTLTP